MCRLMLSHVLRELRQAGYNKAELINISDQVSACMCYLRAGKDAGFPVVGMEEKDCKDAEMSMEKRMMRYSMPTG